MATISIIIPVYNTAQYVAECLDSVLAQSFKDIEIVCVNDGSTDNSVAILKKYQKKDKRIKVITQKNKGLSGARNAGLKAATGKWVCFLDSDDILPPKALEVLYGGVQKTGCQIVASRVLSRVFEQKSVKPQYTIHNGLRDFVRDPKIFSSACNKLYEAKLFCTQRFKEGMLFEDWPVMTILFGRVDKYATTDVPCYIYRQNNASITRSSFSVKKIDGYVQGVRMVYQAYKGTKQLKVARKRMAVAVKMLVNKVYRAKDKALVKPLLKGLNGLFGDRVIAKSDLPIKTRWRLFLLKLQ